MKCDSLQLSLFQSRNASEFKCQLLAEKVLEQLLSVSAPFKPWRLCWAGLFCSSFIEIAKPSQSILNYFVDKKSAAANTPGAPLYPSRSSKKLSEPPKKKIPTPIAKKPSPTKSGSISRFFS